MHIHRRFRSLIVASLSVAIVPSAVAYAQQSTAAYTVTDLGGLPGLAYRQSVAFAINDAGEIAGSSYTAGPNGPTPHAIIWAPNANHNYVITDLGIPSAATGISNAGVVGTNWGFIVVPATVNGELVWYEDADGDGHNDLEIPISTGGRAVVNDNMQIADGNHLVQFDATGNEIVTTLPNQGSAITINDYGEVAGHDQNGIATIWEVDRRGNVVAADTLPMLSGYAMSSALCIDPLERAAGSSGYFKKNQYHQHATLWMSSSGPAIDLGSLAGSGGISQAFGINDVNGVVQVVGYSETRTSGTAFLWKNGVMNDLNKLISANGVTLEEAYAINAHGQIVATAAVTVGKNVETHAVLLTPN